MPPLEDIVRVFDRLVPMFWHQSKSNLPFTHLDTDNDEIFESSHEIIHELMQEAYDDLYNRSGEIHTGFCHMKLKLPKRKNKNWVHLKYLF